MSLTYLDGTTTTEEQKPGFGFLSFAMCCVIKFCCVLFPSFAERGEDEKSISK